MAEGKDPKEQEKVQDGEIVEANGAVNAKSSPPWPIITVSVFITVVLFALFAAGWAWVGNVVHLTAANENTRMSRDAQREYSDEMPGSRGSLPYEGRRGAMTAAASGVIVKIDGDTVTVAGQGKQVIVKTTDDTIVSGDESDLAVNDTVIVIGDTEDDDTVVAKRFVVRNEPIEEWNFQGRQSRPSA